MPPPKSHTSTQRVGFEPLCMVEGSANRLVDVNGVVDTDPPVGLLIAMNGERLVRRGADKSDRSPRDYAATEVGKLIVGIADQAAKERRQ